ncbi:hypothetical protein K461DRAFT_113982 [Myriangium duriaei CBS 260.36]|uniref:Rhodopsin domain-containing protein n=1 Tax=Myriangium duriaei CBS 260.36 TaxID=1168546 RepID=A0A9P4MKY8_9PEZI|nr:hypothetical protein K461DRAFT_113982 [Myriangium duriaei CBS 260.36]
MGGLLDTHGLPSGFGASVYKKLERETAAEYAVGVIVVVLRIYARIRKLGFRGLQIDDYLMISALGWYTVLLVFDNGLARSAGSAIPIPGEDLSLLSDTDIIARQNGAKITLVMEEAMVNTLWTLKACLLLMYSRLTMGARNNFLVKLLSAYCVIGWVAVQLSLFLQCRPITNYWQIRPTPDRNCEVYWTYIAVQMTFNISSDIAMLFIPLPMVMGVKVNLKQKAILLGLFSMGLFVIGAALATKLEYYLEPEAVDFVYWYYREASVALYVANLPMIWPLVRETIPGLKSFLGYGYGKSSKQGDKTSKGFGASGHATGMRSTVRGTIIDREDGDLETGKGNGKAFVHETVEEEKKEDYVPANGIRAEVVIVQTSE